MTLRKALNNYVETSDTVTDINIYGALEKLQAAFIGMATEDTEAIGAGIFDAVRSLVEIRERRQIMEDLLRFMADHSDTEED